MTGRRREARAEVASRLHVLVVDDSAVVRQLSQQTLGQHFDVSVAADPFIAMDKMKRARPDVILLDLDLPRMDGLSFLRKLMSEDPIPVVVCSGLAGPRTEAALRALEEGAVEIVAKPSVGVGDFLRESREMLCDSLRAAAVARVWKRPAPPVPPPPVRVPCAPARGRSGSAAKLVAIGASTGGTEAIRWLLESLPADSPPLVIVQHMPEFYTRAFAERLHQVSRLEVKEAADGDRLRTGQAVIAPGNRHLLVRGIGDGFEVGLDDGPLVSRHRPSVDVLFRSVARAAGGAALGVLLTGMGSDGAEGLLEMRACGAPTIAQDESTSIVFGMPKEAIARGAAAQVLALGAIPEAILKGPRRPPDDPGDGASR